MDPTNNETQLRIFSPCPRACMFFRLGNKNPPCLYIHLLDIDIRTRNYDAPKLSLDVSFQPNIQNEEC
jgi:hypothetical protein